MYSTENKNDVLERLNWTREGLIAAVAGLSQQQLDLQPSPDGWSISGIVEHIASVDEAVATRVLVSLMSTPPVATNGNLTEADARLWERVCDRSVKIQAPDPLHPKGQPLTISLERFAASRKRIAEFLDAPPPDLRLHAIPHPALGLLDGHQWLLACAGHCARHTQQLLETKAAIGGA